VTFSFTHAAHIRNVYVDASDNVFVTGAVSGTDDYIRKYNSAGVKQWESSGGGVDGLTGDGLDADSSGNLYVGGDSLAGNTNYIAKYNSSGALQWETTHDASANVASGGIAVDSNDDIWCAHRVASGSVRAIKFDSSGSVLVTLSKTHSGYTDIDAITDIVVDSADNIYVISGNELTKLNSSGVVQWQKTKASVLFNGLAVNGNDDVVVVMTYLSGVDAHLYNSSGVEQWTRQLNDCVTTFALDSTLSSAGFDSSNNLYVGGYNVGG